MEVASSFADGSVAVYRPSVAELGLGVGGIAIAALLTTVVMRLFRIMPMSLADDVVEAKSVTPAAEEARAV